MAFRMRFKFWLPPATGAFVHSAVDARLSEWQTADRIHDLRDTGRADPEGREIELRARVAQGTASTVRGQILALIQAEPGVKIWAHRCRHGLEDRPCEYEEVYP